MRIKQLELIGFKSFPHRTVLEIPKGVTGIVGPNGCGKSNVVDAIRWALGEQSPKHLRGEAMEAVIFNGNEKRSPLGMAEVSLTFENDGGGWSPKDVDPEVSTLPAQFRDLAEIKITRRYFRSGDSEYFINMMPCRLKDITELFLGTGVGSKAYAIIEQGRVGDLTNAKPEDRRLFIEEAAGTTLYRSRKLAAERKMERTRENLSRVSDILHEIDRQISYLQRQAKKAEEYKRLQEEVRRLDLALFGMNWCQLRAQLWEIETAWHELDERERYARAELEESRAAEQQAAETLAEAEHRNAELREAIAVLDAERESLRQRLQMLAQQRDERERRRQGLFADLQAIKMHHERVAESLDQLEREREEWTRRLASDERELAEKQSALVEARRAAAEAQSRLENAKTSLVDVMTREVEARNTVVALGHRREEIARQWSRVCTEEDDLRQHLRQIDEQLQARHADLASLRERLAAAAGEREARAQKVRTLAELRRRWEREAVELESAVAQLRSRLESLEQIQQNYEGFDRSVRAMMRERRDAEGVLGVVADVIDIPEQYERAAAAVLGDRLQYMIVRGQEDGAQAVNILRQKSGGRGSFIPLAPRLEVQKLQDAASLNGTSKRLLDLVRFDERYRHVAEALLGEVVLVPDLNAAVEIWKRNGVYVTLVTPEGDVVSSAGVITGGSDRPVEEEILARRREIETLRAQLVRAAERLSAVKEESEQVYARLQGEERALKTLGDDVHELTLRIVAAEKDIERLEIERPQCISRLEVVRYEAESLGADDEALSAELRRSRAQSEELACEHQQREQEVAALRLALDEASERVESLSAEVTAVKVRVAERRERHQAAAASAEALRVQRIELGQRANALEREIERTAAEHDSLREEIAFAELKGTEQESRRADLVATVEAQSAEVTRCGAMLKEQQSRTREIANRIDEVRAGKAQLDVSRSESRLRLEHIEQTVRERYESDLGLYVEEGTRTGGLPEISEEDAARLETLRTRLSRIGDVNVGAIEELRELEERAGFLRAQKEDLERSLADLERTIHKLNRISRTRFAETFARVNEAFQKVFPRLFRGGEGRLVLTDENNLLETGVDIFVRPPGKKLDNMSALSGGEKALVAVALIFSLFLVNPTPFCVLDEVDAPLDDANIGRFNQLVREMSDRLQFLIITHNKRTMEAADALYGITMQEPGVSKVISVILTESA